MAKNTNMMIKTVIVYGLIAGAIVAGLMHLTTPLTKDIMNFDWGMQLGYLTMVIALALIFFGVKVYRDKHQNGGISFGKAFLIGLYITIVASIVYAANWEFMLSRMESDFMEEYSRHYIEKMQKEGASQAEIDEMVAEMDSMKEMYKNPVIRFGITIFEIFPVGLVISFISTALLHKREVLPST